MQDLNSPIKDIIESLEMDMKKSPVWPWIQEILEIVLQALEKAKILDLKFLFSRIRKRMDELNLIIGPPSPLEKGRNRISGLEPEFWPLANCIELCVMMYAFYVMM